MQVGEVEPFIAPGLEGVIFLADTIADHEGRHRVYTLKDGTRGDFEFSDVAGVLHWMTAQVQNAKGELDDAELQDVQKRGIRTAGRRLEKTRPHRLSSSSRSF